MGFCKLVSYHHCSSSSSCCSWFLPRSSSDRRNMTNAAQSTPGCELPAFFLHCAQGMLNYKMTCFSSSDPAAVNATLLFDLENDDENLWTRSSHGGPLPLCSSPSSPPDFPCWVCLEQKVYAVCRNLTDGVKMMMEAGGVSVDLLKSDCPKPSSDGDGGASESQLLAIIIPILLLLIIFIGVLLYIFRKKSCWNPSEPNRVVVVGDRKLRSANNQSPSPTGHPEGVLLTSCFRLET